MKISRSFFDNIFHNLCVEELVEENLNMNLILSAEEGNNNNNNENDGKSIDVNKLEKELLLLKEQERNKEKYKDQIKACEKLRDYYQPNANQTLLSTTYWQAWEEVLTDLYFYSGTKLFFNNLYEAMGTNENHNVYQFIFAYDPFNNNLFLRFLGKLFAMKSYHTSEYVISI
jgi:hypothetical protein